MFDGGMVELVAWIKKHLMTASVGVDMFALQQQGLDSSLTILQQVLRMRRRKLFSIGAIGPAQSCTVYIAPSHLSG